MWSFRFLLQSLEDLDSSLRKLNSRLFVIRGQPTDVFPRLFKVTASSKTRRQFAFQRPELILSPPPLRNGIFPVCPTSTTLSPLGRSAMQPSRSWRARLGWR